MKYSTLLKIGFIIIAACQFSCRKDFSTLGSNGNLSFSSDTLFLDTVFNNTTTTTHLLTVYNKSKNDVTIPKIKLAKDNSKYRINVDGLGSENGTSINEFEDILLLSNDSLYIFIEVTASALDTNDEMLYTDKILFDPNGNKQEVDLITLVKDVEFLFSATETDYEITQTQFTNTKPYVIYGNAIVPKNGSLTIDAGSTVYFNKDASLTISEGATLNINGTKTDSIVFKSDVLNYEYDQIPGQWQGININNASAVNINYLKILNPITGLKITNNTNPISLKNTEIYNAAQNAIYTTNTTLSGENIVIGQTGKSSLFLQGGDYSFKHCTFANYWSKGIRTESTITLANYYLDNQTEITVPLNSANFINCIISGSKNNELLLDKSEEESAFNFNIKNSLLDLEKGEDLYDTENSALYTSVFLNKTLDFKDTTKNDLRIGLENEGINQADITTASQIPIDIIGTDRTVTPDIGAYQHIDFETLEPKEEDE